MGVLGIIVVLVVAISVVSSYVYETSAFYKKFHAKETGL